MGNSFFCNRCDIEKFNLSRACADQFLNDDKEKEITSEERWILKLKCLDDAHSKQLGLTQEVFNDLIDTLDKQLHSKNLPVYCRNKELLLECLSRNPNCMLNCNREMLEFIDCVDTARISRVKQKIQETMTKKKRVDLEDILQS